MSIRLNNVNKTLKSMYSILGVEKNDVIIESAKASEKTRSFLNILNICAMLFLRELMLNISNHPP
ncbi:hypothetical protein [Clostridium estertheticum]|uniref:hypothetical protein n=1 Tax=Clostridium estertheticum TaxID=238834 RepID=UPI000B131EDA|nr:hypothetical protein [Clostridium estertheticum]WAG75751.1 hypothetical protein LL032_10430 [Clostridium estertheticum]